MEEMDSDDEEDDEDEDSGEEREFVEDDSDIESENEIEDMEGYEKVWDLFRIHAPYDPILPLGLVFAWSF